MPGQRRPRGSLYGSIARDNSPGEPWRRALSGNVQQGLCLAPGENGVSRGPAADTSEKLSLAVAVSLALGHVACAHRQAVPLSPADRGTGERAEDVVPVA